MQDVTCCRRKFGGLILDGEPSTVDITPFRFERFAEGEYGYGHLWK